jgi:hypothetical protein
MFGHRTPRGLLLSVAFILTPAMAQSQDEFGPRSTADSAVAIDGPAPPVAPATIARDVQGRATIRAVRISESVRVDGQLDENIYRMVEPVGGFIQTDPNPGAPATEQTDVWIFFDSDTLYVGARLWDSQPEDRWVANEMRRDSMNVVRNENLAIFFDTFYDRRNAFLFEISPIGGIYDAHVTNERAPGNVDYNPVWRNRAGRFEGGWTAEMAIPFRSLRYRPGGSQVWGVNIRRTVRWKNEESFVVPMPLSQGSPIFQISSGATLVGIDAPSGSRNLEIKPYAIAGATTDRRSDPPTSNDIDRDVGFDVKYGVTQNLTADVTFNTDFAQVEVDEQQVNLTRFSLFFPEKREFFLEGQGLFDFGGASGSSGGGLAPLLFFSRRIGLNGSRVVPIDAGGRLTGKIGRLSLGLLDVRTGEDVSALSPATNFGVLRVKSDILRRSSVGVLATSRSHSVQQRGGHSATYGADATLGFYDNLTINTYLAKTDTPGLSGDDVSYRAQLSYSGDRYGLGAEHLFIGDNFNPEVGFVRRDDVRASAVSLRFSPRPRASPLVRRYSYSAGYEYLTDGDGRLETEDWNAQFSAEFHSSDRLSVSYQNTYDVLEQPFDIAPGVTIPVGGYDYEDARASMSFGNQRKLSGSLSFSHGTFYDGARTSAGFSSGRLEIDPRFSVEPSVSINWIDLPYGRFTTQLTSSRATFTVTPRLFMSGLLQYNSSNESLSSNLRLRWEYQPGSELFVVYTDERDTMLRQGFPDLRNRAFVVKINRLMRF